MSKLVGFRLPDTVIDRMDALGAALGLPRSGVVSLAVSLLYRRWFGEDASDLARGAYQGSGVEGVQEVRDDVGLELEDDGEVFQDTELRMDVDEVQALLRQQAEERKRRKEERKRKKKASKRR